MKQSVVGLLVAVLLSGCDNARLSGEVGGEGVGGARDAFYDTLEFSIPILGNYKLLVVVLTDFPDGCAVFDDLFAAVESSCDATCDAVVSKAEAHGLNRDDYWSTTFTVNASEAVNTDFVYDTDLAAGHFTTRYSSWNAAPFHDTTACQTACDDGNLFTSVDTDGSGGTLTLDQNEDVIGGKFDVDLGDGGKLGGAFAANPCDMGQWSIFD